MIHFCPSSVSLQCEIEHVKISRSFWGGEKEKKIHGLLEEIDLGSNVTHQGPSMGLEMPHIQIGDGGWGWGVGMGGEEHAVTA